MSLEMKACVKFVIMTKRITAMYLQTHKVLVFHYSSIALIIANLSQDMITRHLETWSRLNLLIFQKLNVKFKNEEINDKED